MEELGSSESVKEYKKLVFNLTTMLEIGKTLNMSLSLSDVLDIIILTCSGHFHASDAVMLLETEEKGQSFFIYRTVNNGISFGPSHPFTKFIKENQRILHLKELKAVKMLKDVYELFHCDDIELIVPLRFKGQINGILCLKKKEKGFGQRYTVEEERFIDIIAGFASVAIENARLYEMATIDRKTKLYNHGYFQNKLTEEMERAERYKTDLNLIIMDLDHFKNVNDTYGHVVGDEVLIKVAKTVKQQVRSFDTAARFGGEEFTVILPETDSVSAVCVAERLRRTVEILSFNASRRKLSITVSIGVTHFVHSANITEDMFIEQADKALYYAKEHGRNQVAVYDKVVGKI